MESGEFVVFIQDQDGMLTCKELTGKPKQYFKRCKNIASSNHFSRNQVLSSAEQIRDVLCPCCLDENDHFVNLVGLAFKKGLIRSEGNQYFVCVGCLMKEC